MPGRQLGGERRSAGEKRPVCQRARLEAKREWPPGFLKIQGTQTFISYRDLWVMKATPDTCEKACQDLSPQLPRDGFQKPQNNQRSPCNVQTGNASKSQSFTLKPLTLFDPFKKKKTQLVKSTLLITVEREKNEKFIPSLKGLILLNVTFQNILVFI